MHLSRIRDGVRVALLLLALTLIGCSGGISSGDVEQPRLDTLVHLPLALGGMLVAALVGNWLLSGSGWSLIAWIALTILLAIGFLGVDFVRRGGAAAFVDNLRADAWFPLKRQDRNTRSYFVP